MLNKTQEKVTFADLARLLKQLGFVDLPTAGSQVVFEYPDVNFLIVLPPHAPSELVPMRHLVGIRSQLDELGLMSLAAFDGFAEKVPA
jgi:predicted RNA binding protein YcfA (HicA-like mRNA interferase family)